MRGRRTESRISLINNSNFSNCKVFDSLGGVGGGWRGGGGGLIAVSQIQVDMLFQSSIPLEYILGLQS
jgi:hypothetical protein